MPDIDITLQGTDLNISAQVGDTLYYATPAGPTGGFSTVATGAIVTIGPIAGIAYTGGAGGDQTVITATIPNNVANPGESDFLFFSKDNKANSNGLLGYYALAKMENNSTTDAELFSVATEFFESSK
jgi:hypothetical protein